MSVLKQIIGNKRNIEHLSEANSKEKLSHAYIINGPKGSGKSMLADFAACALMCDELNEDPNQQSIFAFMGNEAPAKRTLADGPCGSCPSCARSLSGNHPDIIHLKREKEKVISVNDIRKQIVEDIAIKPYYGKYKIYIVEDAHLMNENAQNALLKTIEEPPDYGIIFLLSDNAESFLDTIRSRCIRLDMEKLDAGQIQKELEERFGVSKEDAATFAAFSAGNLGRAISICEDETEGEFIRSSVSTLKKLADMNAVRIFEAAAENKDRADDFLEIARMWYRDMLVIKADSDAALYFPQEKRFLKEAAAKISYEKINNIWKSMDTAKKRLDVNVKSDAVLENMFLAMRRNYK